jgi:hypothetical protein
MTHVNPAFAASTWVRDIQTNEGSALLDIKNGACFAMNPVGARIWNMLKLEYSADQIIESIATEFGLCHSQVERDVRDFLQSLSERGLAIPAGSKASRRRNWFSRLLRLGTREIEQADHQQ